MQFAGPGLAPLWQCDRRCTKLSQEFGWCCTSALGCVLWMSLPLWLGWQNFIVCTCPYCLLDLALEKNYLEMQGGDCIWFFVLIRGQKQISHKDSGGNSLENRRVWLRIEWNNWDSPKRCILAIEPFHMEPPAVQHQAFPRRSPASGQISNVYKLGALNQSRNFLLEMVSCTQLFDV